MAKFNMELPTELIKNLENYNKDVSKVMGEMTQAGAKVFKENIEKNAPESFKKSDIMKCLKITKVYRTPTDDGINTRVNFYGYFINSKGEKVPAPLVVNVTEYGSSTKKKKSFMRKSFNKAKVEKAMEEVFEKSLPKELKE
jgi:hypothetical protein